MHNRVKAAKQQRHTLFLICQQGKLNGEY